MAISFVARFKKINLFFWIAAFFSIFFVYLFINRGVRDVELLAAVGHYALNRTDIYYIDSNHQLYPYLPLLSPILGIILFISRITSVSFLTIWRFFIISTLFASAYLIKLLLEKSNDKKIGQKIALFIFSPLSLFPVAFHGHPDVLVSFFYLASLYLFFAKKEKQVFASILFGLSVLAKTWSVFFIVPMLTSKLRFRDKIKFSIISFLTIMFVILFYVRFWHSSISRIFEAASGYGGSWVVLWGPQGLYTLMIKNTHFFPSIVRRLWVIIVLIPFFIVAYRKKFTIIKASEFTMLTVFLFSFAWATQYTFWVWPFIVLSENIERVRIFSFLSLPFILVSYYSFIFNMNLDTWIVFSSLPLWLYAAWLWYTSIRKIAK